MIKGLAITPPVIGRISIGRVVEKNGKRLPEKDDSFTLTTQIQGKDGWLLHPLHQKYADESPNAKIRTIPVRVLFNDSDLNLRAEFSAFDRTTGRPLCVGNGETARRVTGEGMIEQVCSTPERCAFAKQSACKLYGRLNVQIDGQHDELGSFIFRTTGYNSVRTLAARLRYFEAVSGGNTKHLPLLLRLRARSTTQSHRAPVFYVDLTLRDEDSLPEAICFARDEAIRYQQAGVETDRLEAMARQLLQNGQFEEGEEEIPALLDEFWPEDTGEAAAMVASANGSNQPATVVGRADQPNGSGQSANSRTPTRSTRLTSKLGQPAAQQAA